MANERMDVEAQARKKLAEGKDKNLTGDALAIWMYAEGGQLALSIMKALG